MTGPTAWRCPECGLRIEAIAKEVCHRCPKARRRRWCVFWPVTDDDAPEQRQDDHHDGGRPTDAEVEP